MPSLGLRIYKGVASFLARRFSKFKEVLGVYIRGSVSSGDVILGKSDIDIVVLINRFNDPIEEAKFLYCLSREYFKIKRFFPIIGECAIFDDRDLQRWFKYRTYRAYQSKKWITLYGHPIDLSRFGITQDDILRELLWWISNYLQVGYINNDVKLLSNVLIKTMMLTAYLQGELKEPILERRNILDYLIGLNDENKKYYIQLKKLTPYYFMGRYTSLIQFKKFAFITCISLLDDVYYLISEKLAGSPGNNKCFTRWSLNLLPRQYLILHSPVNKREIENQLAHLIDLNHILITENILNLYLFYYYPLEFYALKKYNKDFNLSEPPKYVVDKFITMYSSRYLIRLTPFFKAERWNIYNLIAQARLYCDYNFIAPDREELIQQYQFCYGKWPFIENASLKEYFLHDYPIMWEILEEIYEKRI